MKNYSPTKYVCENCKYYIEHYIYANTTYQPTKGHCINKNIIYKRLKFELRESCEFWEDGKPKKEKRKETIKETLRCMEKHLADIADILSKE